LAKERQLLGSLKKGGHLYAETARYLVPKRKEERKELHEKLKGLVTGGELGK
jgi:hypothetical protein